MPQKQCYNVIIIGAGVSGIAAAATLWKNGITNFRILEAESRIGGRVNTSELDNIPIELGAEWIHGEIDNVVFEHASKFDLADNDTESLSFWNTAFYDFSGHQINKDLSLALVLAYSDIMNTSEKDFSDEVLKGSVGNYFELEFQKVVDDVRKKFNIDTELSKKFLKTFENWENTIDASHSWYETSLKGHLEYWECGGNGLTTWKNSHYDTVFSVLTEFQDKLGILLPEIKERISFNKEVIKINWNKECSLSASGAEVECSDGSKYFADAVLITCSLGVLKERAKEMFSPALPLEKLNCIENLGFGTVDKIFVKFDYSWWKNNFDGFGFLWSDEERKNDSSGWLNGVVCFHPINKESSVLRGWIAGEAAQVMESLSNEEVLQGLNYLFNKFLGPTLDIPAIKVCVTSKWYTNSHFRGSYSCRLMKSEAANVWASQLAKPLLNDKGVPVVLFGGEATHDHYFSTVHGAVEAGQREAQRLLPLFRFSSTTNPQVIIIGAGISGLAAAKTLVENGVPDVVILEAQSEPGGRIRSLQIEDYFIELGAQWIHGAKNEVFALSQENNLLTNECSSEGEGMYLRENGEQVDETLIRQVDDVVKDILENCENYVSTSETITRSIGEELSLKFNQYLESCTQDTEEIKKIKRELFDWHVRFQLIDNSCSDLFNLSAKAWGHFKFCGGIDYNNFKNGYSSLIQILTNSLAKVIRCNTPVERIEWKEEINKANKKGDNFDPGDYCVTCRTNNDSFHSQYVIVTSSLGYLKENFKDMFCPHLPNYLSEAIESLDFGVINKIFLIYDKPWWDEQVRGFQLVWSNETSGDSDKHWGRYVTGFDVIINNQPVLLGWVGGEGAKEVEKIPEEEIGRQVTEILRKFTRKQQIPLPSRVIRTRWWSNEYVRGAYSSIPVKCDNSEICCSNLAQPAYSTVITKTGIYRKPTILLAGESTHKNYFSTVHGAYESGQNQARVILEDIRSGH